MANRAENKMHPIQHYVKIMLFISFSALILDFVISFASIAIVKQQSSRYLRDTADLYIDRIDSTFTYINRFMGWTLANDENVEALEEHDVRDAAFLKANRNLYKRVAELQSIYGKEYNFFLYLGKGKNVLLNGAPMSISYPEYSALKEQIEIFVKDKNLYEKYYSVWSTIDLNGKSFILNIVPYYDSYMICLVSADDLIRPLRGINLGENGYASLAAGSGGREDGSSPGSLLQARTTVDAEFTNASFHVRLVIQFGAFEKIMIAQLLIILLAVIIACSLCFILLYFKNKVLKPIKTFSYNLTLRTAGGEPLDIESYGIVELEKASKQFAQLFTQLKKFKIDLYEREIEKQRMQLNYMKLQIKPHFFLNCLTSIYSMAQMQMHEEIERMTLSTSQYFRYIFRNERDFVRLEDELRHIRIYLDIQKHRYRDAFVYRIERNEAGNEAKIPPLVLQTFVENAVKYAVSREREARIVLEVDRRTAGGEPATVIRIADTGPGFPPRVLAQLNAAQPLDQSGGTHIGIANTLQRLEYLYRGKAAVRFSNPAGGGASVVLYLPDDPSESAEMERAI